MSCSGNRLITGFGRPFLEERVFDDGLRKDGFMVRRDSASL